MVGVMLSAHENNDLLKKDALTSICNILISRYDLTEDLANELIKRSKIDQIFDRNAEIASHTSYKTWAQRAYEQLEEDDYASEHFCEILRAGHS